jgi:putative endonuclease
MDKQELGQHGEDLAVDFLQQMGYEILARNWRYGKGELDIVARIGQELVIVEVKTRETDFFGNPADFVSKAQQRQLIYTADAYWTRYPDAGDELRFDIVSIVVQRDQPPQITHYDTAFYPTL